MDIARPDLKHKHLTLYGVADGGVLPLVVVGRARLEPALALVQRGSGWRDTAKRGELSREVRGLGTRVPKGSR